MVRQITTNNIGLRINTQSILTLIVVITFFFTASDLLVSLIEASNHENVLSSKLCRIALAFVLGSGPYSVQKITVGLPCRRCKYIKTPLEKQRFDRKIAQILQVHVAVYESYASIKINIMMVEVQLQNLHAESFGVFTGGR